MGTKSFLGESFRFIKKLDRYIFTYLTPSSKASLWGIRGKMLIANKFYGISHTDFLQCRCDQTSFHQISSIVPFREQKDLWCQVNQASSRVFLYDKFKAYLRFKDYFHREVVFVNDRKTEDEFVSFCRTHSRFIVKPLSSFCGKGIQLIDTNKGSCRFESILGSYPDGFIIEELIEQDEVLSKLHPESVNTVRINTANYGTSVEIKWPCLRIGRGKSIVDNAGAGGIFGAIDITNGFITDVSDEYHHTFTEHPDTGVPLIGFQVPKWKEACELAKHLASLIPDCRFVAWDLALTEKGWVMVEGNHCPLLIYQIATGKGIRKEFSEMKKRLLQK